MLYLDSFDGALGSFYGDGACLRQALADTVYREQEAMAARVYVQVNDDVVTYNHWSHAEAVRRYR